VRYLSIALSHPEWLVARWIARVGFENAEAWCRFNNEPPHITVRSIKPRSRDELLEAIRTAGIDAAPARFVDDAITLPPGGLGSLPPDLAGTLFVQDEASQVVAHAVGATSGERILDLCASPGAKTVVISTDQGGTGLLVACDYRASRVRLLHRTLRTAAVAASIVTLDATRALPFPPVFDCVFVDVPCSGLGIIRRDPDLKWSRQPDDLAAFAWVQRQIVARAADAVAPGGRLVYATCSSEPEENESVIDTFLAEDSRFELGALTPGHAGGSAAMLVDSRGFLRTTPVAHGLDGFFAALLVRTRGVTSASRTD
jgi:16S rRNA (cytosine967-C5)-methyltransferase